MSVELYTRLQETFARLVAEKGRTATLIRAAEADYDPVASAPENAAEAAGVSVSVVVLGLSEKNAFSFAPDTRVIEGDRKILMTVPADGSGLSVGDRLVDGTDRWIVLGINELRPGTVTVGYVLHARLQ